MNFSHVWPSLTSSLFFFSSVLLNCSGLQLMFQSILSKSLESLLYRVTVMQGSVQQTFMLHWVLKASVDSSSHMHLIPSAKPTGWEHWTTLVRAEKERFSPKPKQGMKCIYHIKILLVLDTRKDKDMLCYLAAIEICLLLTPSGYVLNHIPITGKDGCEAKPHTKFWGALSLPLQSKIQTYL